MFSAIQLPHRILRGLPVFGVALGFSLMANPIARETTEAPLLDLRASIETHAETGIPGTNPPPLELDWMSTGSVATGVFGSVAFPFKPGALDRWRNIEGEFDQLSPDDCGGSMACKIRISLFHETSKAVEGQPVAKKIAAINTAANLLIKYTRDLDAHGKLDYWASPTEIFTAGKGDCEDYAIVKMAALRKAGIPAESMALVVIRDVKRNFFHAVLAVSTNNNYYILDNLTNEVLTDRQLPQYQALYSLGTDQAWVHGYRRTSQFAMQKRPTSLDKVQPGEGILGIP